MTHWRPATLHQSVVRDMEQEESSVGREITDLLSPPSTATPSPGKRSVSHQKHRMCDAPFFMLRFLAHIPFPRICVSVAGSLFKTISFHTLLIFPFPIFVCVNSTPQKLGQNQHQFQALFIFMKRWQGKRESPNLSYQAPKRNNHCQSPQ